MKASSDSSDVRVLDFDAKVSRFDIKGTVVDIVTFDWSLVAQI